MNKTTQDRIRVIINELVYATHCNTDRDGDAANEQYDKINIDLSLSALIKIIEEEKERIEIDEGKLADLIEFNVDLFLEKNNDPFSGAKITSIKPKKLAHILAAHISQWVKIC